MLRDATARRVEKLFVRCVPPRGIIARDSGKLSQIDRRREKPSARARADYPIFARILLATAREARGGGEGKCGGRRFPR